MPARKIKTPADLHSIKPQSKIGSSPETPVLPELPSFPDIAWRGVFDVYRQAMEGSTAASDVAHFCTLWAAVASALGRRIHMYSGGIVYPNVYLCNFGPTGDHKTTAQRRLKECDLLAGQTVRYVQNVGSTEGLSDLLSKAERGVYLCYWEEFASFLAHARWSGSTLLEFVTETFDCPQTFERSYRKTPISLNTPTPTILTGTTTEWFWKYARADDFFGGFGNRFLYLSGPKKPLIANPVEPDPFLLSKVKEHLAALDKIHPGRMEWTLAAKTEWEKFFLVFEQQERRGLLAAALKRIHVYIRKLAMVYSALEGQVSIDVEQVRAAIAVGRFAAACAEQLIDLQTQSHKSTGDLEEKFIAWIKKHEGRRVRDMQQALQRYCGDSQTFNAVRMGLEKADRIEDPREESVSLGMNKHLG